MSRTTEPHRNAPQSNAPQENAPSITDVAAMLQALTGREWPVEDVERVRTFLQDPSEVREFKHFAMQISLQRRFDELIEAFQQRPLSEKEKKVIRIACSSHLLSKNMDHFPKTDSHDAVLVSRLRQFLCPSMLLLTFAFRRTH